MMRYGLFTERMKALFAAKKPDEHMFLLSIDFLNFKLVNHLYGPVRGTELLRAAADYLDQIPEILLWDKIYADQFTFLVRSKQTDIIPAYRRYAEAFLAREQAAYPGCNLRLACGIYPLENGDILTAIDNVNAAREEAKRGDAPHIYQTDGSLVARWNAYYEKEQAVNSALNAERFTFFLQPKVHMMTGEIVGAEALARGIDEDGNTLSPDTFLDIMERNGSVVKLDILILRQVCTYMAARLALGLAVVPTSVNLSRLHIGSAETAEKLHAIVQEYKIPTELIEFELTETILLEEFTGAKQLIDALRGYGYRVSIDDFGAGYAGISIWQKMNFDVLKLDKSFLDKRFQERNAAIVPNIIDIAQRLGVEIVCEGVEEDAQCQSLLNLGCTVAQGFLFSRPVPANEFYRNYESLHGYFCRRQPIPASKEPYRITKKKKLFPYLSVILLCTMILGVATFCVFNYYMHTTRELFDKLAERNLVAFTTGQVTATNSYISEVTHTLESCATLARTEHDILLMETYISTLNRNDPRTHFSYSSKAYYDKKIAEGKVAGEELEALRRLERGETVISDVAFSHRMGDIYCFVIGVPVMEGGEYVGCLRAIIDTNRLITSDHIASPYGDVVGSFLTDERGNIIDAQVEDQRFASMNTVSEVADRLGLELTKRERRNLEELSSIGNRGSMNLGSVDGIPYHIAVEELSLKDWNLVVLFEANNIQLVQDELFHQAGVCAGILIAVVLAVCLMLSMYLRKWQDSMAFEKKRYMLLEQFSDTVLFDYDRQKDFMHFTPNVRNMFQVEGLELHDFSKNLSVLRLYPGDYPTMERVLSGRGLNEDRVRVRLMRPDAKAGEYFWCLIQYIYVFDHEKLASVIGKIIDIDEQKSLEERLEIKAAMDGLTRLYNKASAEERVGKLLREDLCGTLILLDIDDFKAINDRYGHDRGDEVLRTVADCLRDAFREDDVLGRIGGDEMLVYMRNSREQETAVRKLEEVQKMLCALPDGWPRITISAGVACYPTDGNDYSSLFHAADQAMYKAKRSGKDRIYSCEA